jgi:hypothetical protein
MLNSPTVREALASNLDRCLGGKPMAPITGAAEDLAAFQDELSQTLASIIGIPLRVVEEAVTEITADWSVEIHHITPTTDHRSRYVIHTSYQSVED